jgi:parallel beta-helix repeat protein
MKKHIILLGLLLVGVFMLLVNQTAMAATDCTFTTNNSWMILDGDCTTDETILVPDGFTLNGNGYTITAVDPVGGHFLGAIVTNSGTTAHVRNLTIDTDNLSNSCDAGGDRLRGIMFEGASGSIMNNRILNLNQGASGCQEGNSIEVRNAPYDGTHPNTQSVIIINNLVDQYQKGGIISNGDVNVRVERNEVYGLGPVNYIAQNGIQLGFGATGFVANNKVSGNSYSGGGWASGGILVYAGEDNITLRQNRVNNNDVGIWVIDADNAYLFRNSVSGSVYDGIALDAYYASVTGANLVGNNTDNNLLGIGLYGATTTNNVLRSNTADSNEESGFFVGWGSYANEFYRNRARYNVGDGFQIYSDDNYLEKNSAQRNSGSGFVIDGDGNTLYRNRARDNGVLDIDNSGANVYTNNLCQTSTGAPVDCGSAPLTLSSFSQLVARGEAVEGRVVAQPVDQ